MEYEKRVDTVQGTYVVASGIDFEDILLQKPIIINDLTIYPGDMTDLYGWFKTKCRYVGYFETKDPIKEAVFYLGGGKADLFSNGGQYYDITYILTSSRIGKSYKKGSFRDSFLRQRSDVWFNSTNC